MIEDSVLASVRALEYMHMIQYSDADRRSTMDIGDLPAAGYVCALGRQAPLEYTDDAGLDVAEGCTKGRSPDHQRCAQRATDDRRRH